MKHLKRLFVFILVVVLFLVVINLIPWAPTKAKGNEAWLRKAGEAPLIIPHGGAKEMYPENTMYAFDKTSHYDAFEIDLALTKDDILISHHDLDLRLMANREDLKVRDLTYEEVIQTIQEAGFPHVRGFNGNVKKEDYSEWSDEKILNNKIIPVPLRDIFAKYPEKLYILELKDTVKKDDPTSQANADEAVNQLAALIKEFEMEDKVMMASFDDSLVKNFNQVTKDEVGTMSGSMSSAIFAILSYLKLDFFYVSDFDAMSLPYNQAMGSGVKKTVQKFPKFIQKIIATIDEDGTYHYNMQRHEFQKDARRKKIAMIYWTVNDRDDMIALIKRGADGIITDDPELLAELIEVYK
jgi:glycerophosphoryl diester phosphodiesterase